MCWAHLLLKLLQQERDPIRATQSLVPEGLLTEALAKPPCCGASVLEARHQLRCGEKTIAKLQLVPKHEGLVNVVFKC